MKLSTFNDRLSHLKFLSYVESLIESPKGIKGSFTSAAVTEHVVFEILEKSNVTRSVAAAEAVPPTGELDSNQAANFKESTSITKFLITNSNTPLVNN